MRNSFIILFSSTSNQGCKFLPQANKVVCDALSECLGKVILRVGHESDLSVVQAALIGTALNEVPVVSLVDDALSTSPCLLICDELSATQVFCNILTEAPAHSTLHVIDKSWNTLQKSKYLFGDYIPRVGGKAKTVFGDDQQLSLNLWGATSSVTLCNNAEMDPWTNLMRQDDLLELVSARISTRE